MVTVFFILAIFAISYVASLALAVSDFELIRRGGWSRGPLHLIRDLVSPGVLGWFAAASPIGTWQSCLEGTSTAITGSLFAHPVFRYHVLNQGVLFLVSLSVAYWGLTHGRAERSITSKEVIDDAEVLSRRRKRWPFYLIDPLRRTQEIRDRQNPLYVKEKRVGVFSKGHMIVRVSYVGILFSIYLVYRVIADPGVRGLFGVSLLILSFLFLVIPLIASTGISREHEEGTMDLLRASPLTPRRIVWAKFLIVIRFLAVLGVGIVLMPIIFYAFPYLSDSMRETHLQTAVRVLPQLVSFTVLYAAVGVFCSTLWRRNIPAIVTTYGLFMLMNVFPWLLLGVMGLMDPRAPDLNVDLSREPPWIELWVSGPNAPRGVSFLGQGDSPDAAKPPVPASVLFVLKGVCPVISPYFYVALNRPRIGEYAHYFRAWDEWPVLITHAVLVLVLAGVILLAASWRLRTGFRD